MKLRCAQCRQRIVVINGSPDAAVQPWYDDDDGTKHVCVACLKCGCIHDTVISLTGMFNPFGSTLKVTKYAPITELLDQIQFQTNGKNVRAVAKTMLPENIIDALLSRRLVAPGFL